MRELAAIAGNQMRYQHRLEDTPAQVPNFHLEPACSVGWGYGTEREEACRIFDAYAAVGGISSTAADAYHSANPKS